MTISSFRMQFAFRTLSAAINRGARAVFDAGVDTSDDVAVWQALISAGININGYCVRPEFLVDEVRRRVDLLRERRAAALSDLAELDAELLGDVA